MILVVSMAEVAARVKLVLCSTILLGTWCIAVATGHPVAAKAVIVASTLVVFDTLTDFTAYMIS